MHGKNKAAYRWMMAVLPVCVLVMTLMTETPAAAAEPTRIENWDQLYEQIRYHGLERDPEFSFDFSPSMNITGCSEELDNMLNSGGLWTYKSELDGNRLDITRGVYYKDFAFCDSYTKIYEYIQSCAEQNIREFFIFYSPAAEKELLGNDCYGLENQLVWTRLENPSNYTVVEKWHRIVFSNVSYLEKGKNTSQKIGDANTYQLGREISLHTDNLERNFEILLTSTFREVQEPTATGENMPLYEAYRSNLGIMRGVFSIEKHFLVLNGAEYYPGKTIAWYYHNNKTESLDSKQRKTLEEARKIAGATSGSDVLRARQIHDALCARITYDGSREEYNLFGTKNVKWDDGDTAYGALLNGTADCDGYSDAFYLCASLAGLEVGYLNGVKEGKAPEKGRHMRNVILLDGQWRMVDVTWDDQDSGKPSDRYFNIGAEDAGPFIWDKRSEIHAIY